VGSTDVDGDLLRERAGGVKTLEQKGKEMSRTEGVVGV
jgi:hypothetical protein